MVIDYYTTVEPRNGLRFWNWTPLGSGMGGGLKDSVIFKGKAEKEVSPSSGGITNRHPVKKT